MDTILVTGGAGFIGSGIVQRLLSERFNVHMIDNLSSGKIENVEQFKKFSNFKFLKIDLLNSEALDDLQKYKIVYHAAADPEVQSQRRGGGTQAPRARNRARARLRRGLCAAVQQLSPGVRGLEHRPRYARAGRKVFEPRPRARSYKPGVNSQCCWALDGTR